MTSKTRSKKEPSGKEPKSHLPEVAEEFPEPTPPASEDPKAQAEFFLEMLDSFAKIGTAESKRIRGVIIEAVDRYSDSNDKQLAGEELKATLAGIEVGMAEILRKMMAKTRDRMVADSRRLGVATPEGDVVRRGAEGLSQVVKALNKMVQSARQGDEQMRIEAREVLAKAQAQLEPLRK